MTEHVASKLSKWPFFVSDLVLLGLAGLIVYRAGGSLDLWEMAFCFFSVAVGAWIGLTPFLKEYESAVQLAEANALSTAAAQMKDLQSVKNQIGMATAQWGNVQEHSAKTVQAAKELVDRMRREAEEFCKFFEKANETEKAHLRLEAEKLRRSEGDWLQVTVRILDHIFALNQAAARSGQPALISQLSQFQTACRDVARKVGLVPFVGIRDESFDSKIHQLLDGKSEAPANAQIADTVAPGYTFQAQLIRKALVNLKPHQQPELPLVPRENETGSVSPRSAHDPSAAPETIMSAVPSGNAATAG